MTDDELLEYWPWVRKVAHGLCPSYLAEELAQEGWTAIWEATLSWNDSAPLDWWVKQRAQWHMHSLVKNSRWVRQTTMTPGIEIPDIAKEWHTESSDLTYHHREIRRALGTLTPKQLQYVELRFWCDVRTTELRPYFGYDPLGIWAGAKKKLIRELAHLRGE